MTTPELKIDPKLPVMAFNFDQLKAWATEFAERSANLVVTEDAVADVKRDMAELNKAKKAVDDARKEAVRRVSEPIRDFEAKIKEVCGIFDDAYSKLGSQVKVFEDAQREEKRGKVEYIIREALKKERGPGTPPLDIPIQERWLNKSYTTKQIHDDVVAIIRQHNENFHRKAALEQSQKDRAVAIENHVRTLNDKHGLNVPVARFLALGCNPAQPLEDTLDGINAAFTAEVEKKARLEQMRAKNVDLASGWATPPPRQAPAEQPVAPAQTRAMSIVIEYDVANEEKVKACLETLKTLCVNFGARYRQE